MRLVAVASYMGTGSSAVADLLREFSGARLCGPIKYEHVLLHMPNGLFDLEDKLLCNNNAVRSDEAIRSFKQTMNYLYYNNFGWFGSYQRYLGREFLGIVDEFIDHISFVFDGAWYYRTKKMRFSPIDLGLQIGACVLGKRKISDYSGRWGKLCKVYDPHKQYYAAPSADTFYTAARQFIRSYIDLFCRDAADATIIVADQLLLPHNAHRLNRYFDDDLRLIIVDRDPRDVFFANKYFWLPNKCGVPIPTDVSRYCQYFQSVRACEQIADDMRIKRIMFEDMIYNYQTTVEDILEFLNCGQLSHIRQFQYFRPNNSINNTQIFNSVLSSKTENEYIENALRGWLYKFPQQNIPEVEKMFDYDE